MVVTLIGLTLVEVGITSLGGGFDAKASGTFGSLQNLAWAAIVVALIVALNGGKIEWLRMISVIAESTAGSIVAIRSRPRKLRAFARIACGTQSRARFTLA